MSLDRNQLIKVYTTRLVKSLVPKEFGDEFAQSIVYDLLANLQSSNKPSLQKQYELTQLTAHYKAYFLNNGLLQEWSTFERIWDSLSQVKSVDQLHSYLMFFNALQREEEEEESEGNSPRTQRDSSPRLSRRSVRDSSPRISNRSIPPKDSPRISSRSGPQNSLPYKEFSPMEQLIQPFYETLSEETILTYLPYTLLGLDSKLLSIQDDRIELSLNVNGSYAGLLTNILESGLLYKKCSLFVKQYRGKFHSPIKTSFLVQVDLHLSSYSTHINYLFGNQPTSLLFVYNNVYSWILELRLLYLLINKVEQLSGFDFLTHVYELTKYQDIRIRNLTKLVFSQISIPYYELVENWIINGELARNEQDDDEFFITFKLDETNFNDMIQYIPTRKPFFCSAQISYKIFQIGKMLIFLTQICKELQWINHYVNKFSGIIQQQNGFKSMHINSINELIEMQYLQLLNYFTVVVQGEKNEFYQHLVNFKKFYLTQNNDFIDLIISKGSILSESSANISLNYLSKLLIDSINESSVRNNRYAPRLDARILDPIHGNIGWEVFTIEYRIDDLPINAIVEPQMNQYLKMFNFLWRLRHFHYLLVGNAVESANLKRFEFAQITKAYRKIRLVHDNSIQSRKVIWIVKSTNTINLIRNNLIKFLNALLGYLSYDVIEHLFEKLITEKLFQLNQNEESEGKNSLLQLLNALNPTFVHSLQTNSIVHNDTNIRHNMNELTFDELLKLHESYLNTIINNKLINEDSIGKITNLLYIQQIYQLLDVIFRFIRGSEEFNNLLVDYILTINLDDEDLDADDHLDDIEGKLQVLMGRVYGKIYKDEYKRKLGEFVGDLKADIDLKDLSFSFD